jgi:ATP adenylyltransferase
MKKLWAPWRLAFILGPKSKGCIFCRLPKAKRDRENLILYRGRFHYIILNKFPYNNGHLMVVPFRHIKELHRLKPQENTEMMELSGVATRVLDETMGPQGYNLGMNLGLAGGAGIRHHLHMHVVPRWNGDTNYMPILSDTKVLVELITDTYDRLAPAIEKAMKQKRKGK